MPALFTYLIAVALFLGGGYGALSWLTTPEPVKVVATATPNPPVPHYADNSSPVSTRANASQLAAPEPSKPEQSKSVLSKPEVSGTDQLKAAANDKPVSSDQPPSASSSQPNPPAAPSQQEAKAEISDPPRDHRDSPAQVEKPQDATDQGAGQDAEAPPAEARRDASGSSQTRRRTIDPGRAAGQRTNRCLHRAGREDGEAATCPTSRPRFGEAAARGDDLAHHRTSRWPPHDPTDIHIVPGIAIARMVPPWPSVPTNSRRGHAPARSRALVRPRERSRYPLRKRFSRGSRTKVQKARVKIFTGSLRSAMRRHCFAQDRMIGASVQALFPHRM